MDRSSGIEERQMKGNKASPTRSSGIEERQRKGNKASLTVRSNVAAMGLCCCSDRRRWGCEVAVDGYG
ncbi:hypothetical protein C1H46_019010 [Malus baccata]|uniref:Uncharacterized protein n=1 Tax=Malus baccata TaxID=106549 RepID=A0A540MA01_MALBA|nr:hypothetical protein C1H46_019010 [Malus baccata]